VPTGLLHTKIVGVRFYSGFANSGEHVMVKREPTNPYDRNAIRVNNVMGMQIGHIPKTMAAKLAKYMVC
jgi:SWI/SNF-related matrix-associated actin-dependent regulator of chromatin subfamily A3